MGDRARVNCRLVNMSINELWRKSFLYSNIDSKLADMAAKVAVQNFDYRYATLVFFNSTLYYGVELFLHIFNYNVVVNGGMINPNLTKVTQQYVIFDNDVTAVQLLLDNIQELKLENFGKYIFVCQSQISSDCDENEITRLLWEYKIVYAVFIKSEDEDALGYTYFPISDNDCNNVKPIKLISSNGSNYLTTNHGDVFIYKLKKLNSCPLIVSTFIQKPYMDIINGIPTGADGDLILILGYGLNTSIKMMTPHRGVGWGLRQKDGSWMGSLADIYDGLANISITSAVLTQSRYSDFEVSRSYYIKYVGWLTHPATLQNEALKLLYPFGLTTRIALVVSYIFVILCAIVVKSKKWSSISRNIQIDERSRSIAFFSWMICMGQPLLKLPTKSTFLQITIFWIYYCFLMRTAYQVYLINSLKGTYYEDQFETIEDAMKANYPIGGAASLRDFFIDYPEIYDKWKVIDTPDIIPTILNISKGQKFVLAINMDTARLVIKSHKINVYILPRNIVSSPIVMFLKKYSPLAAPLNLVLDQIVAGGFCDMLLKKYISVKTTANDNDNEQEPLKIIHLSACYMVLVTGCILSFIFFLLEYFSAMYTSSRCWRPKF